MTNSQKILITKLLTGHFLRKSSSRGKTKYVLYDKKINPIEVIRTGTVEKIDRFIDRRIKIWKKSKTGDITLNLSMVRRLHGKNMIKQLYKKRGELTYNFSIYKARNNRKKIKSNASTHYLF